MPAENVQRDGSREASVSKSLDYDDIKIEEFDVDKTLLQHERASSKSDCGEQKEINKTDGGVRRTTISAVGEEMLALIGRHANYFPAAAINTRMEDTEPKLEDILSGAKTLATLALHGLESISGCNNKNSPTWRSKRRQKIRNRGIHALLKKYEIKVEAALAKKQHKIMEKQAKLRGRRTATLESHTKLLENHTKRGELSLALKKIEYYEIMMQQDKFELINR